MVSLSKNYKRRFARRKRRIVSLLRRGDLIGAALVMIRRKVKSWKRRLHTNQI